ncbi:MAG: energy coupling factor transporter S component ThiW [Ruminiclostridium sp.]|nr:energy coupling factor transporter S component ThiW [Ruminiclostridium sp.]
MKNSKYVLKLVVLSMLVALGVVISPLLRVEGMCPMAHFINVVCAVLLGPWYSLLCAALIGVIRMALMGIPPLALTGAVFGAFLSGVLYRASKGKILFAVLGEVIGTGIIGAIVSYPVMTFLWGKEGLSWLFYVPSFTAGTLIGGSIAFVFLRKLADGGMLVKMQGMLGSDVYHDRQSALSTALTIAALGAVAFTVTEILMSMFGLEGAVWQYIAYGSLGAFAAAAVVYYMVKHPGREKTVDK